MTPTTRSARMRAPLGRRGRMVAVAGLLALVVPLSGCGTRMSEEKIAAADGSAISAQAANGDAAALGADTGVIAPGTTDTGAVGAVPGAPATGAVPGAPATGGTDATGTNAGGNKGGSAATGGTAAAAGGAAACAQALAPLVIGQTAPTSGIIGASLGNIRSGLALWARAVNAAGGIQCHPVQLYQMDDGADPARVTSNLNTMKSKGAIAIVGAGLPTTFSAARRFAEQNKMPIVGGDVIEAEWFASPYMFPQGGSPFASYAGSMKQAAAKAGSKKVGLIYCVEASICGTINENFEAMAKATGLEVVLRKVSSITSPDYTAECQALKAAGAEAVWLVLEGSGDSRFARSCLSLGYAPPTATSALGVSAEVALDPNLRKLGLFLGTSIAPFLATDTVGGKEFRAAYDRFAPGSAQDQNTIGGWAAGKLLEAALAKVAGKARSGAVTTQLIMEGLWQIKNEKLDGLAPGITFNTNAPATPTDCYYLLIITTQGYTAPLGSKFECIKALPRGF